MGNRRPGGTGPGAAVHTLHRASDNVIRASTGLSRFRCVLARIGRRRSSTAVHPYVARCSTGRLPAALGCESTAVHVTSLEDPHDDRAQPPQLPRPLRGDRDGDRGRRGARGGGRATQRSRRAPPVTGYGPLVPDPAGILALPPGFSYRIVAQAGVTPDRPTACRPPSDPDGNGVFRDGTGSTLVNNHEIGGSEPYGVPPLAGLTYDPGARGGTSTIEVDAARQPARASTPASPARTTTAPAASPRGAPG